MRIIDGYIRKAVLSGTLIALLVLLPLVAFLLLADELDNVGTSRYGLWDAFSFIGLSLPRYAYQILPIAALIGSLWGLGNLAVHSELTALRAAGVSMQRIVLAVLKAGVITALLAVAIGEGLAPLADERGNQLRAEALSERITLKSRYGFWARDGAAFINIRQILPGGRLQNIFIYEFDEAKRLKLATHARSAIYTGEAWRLEGIVQSSLSEQGVEEKRAKQATWRSLIDPGMLSLLVVDPQVLSAWGLQRYIRFMEDNGLSAASYKVAFWNKVATPLVILAMIFLAVPLLFSTFRTVGVGQRIFIGVLIGVGFYIVNQAFSQLAVVYSLSPVLMAFTPAVLCFVVGVWFFRRVR